ncbi:hypothetical protein TanjilG_09885 [Lupinus angustifolius]|uniref:Protein JASON n=1 Tax=Lupinus angustifolius TaxID=3871 RepID=A0A1J7GVB9_LUPAN|nr:PREDICTED: protein JASON-like [Lupinus angustifolius]OIV98233.1 hypothetical protein TanjilG_09885 [Lupinus angustifolius]
MGCFFSCFRVRHNRYRPAAVSSSPSQKPHDVAVSRNRLSTLFLSEEIEDSKHSDGKNFSKGSQRDGSRLKDQTTKFRRACGARTPDEIPKASEKFKVSPCVKDSEPSSFKFLHNNSSAGKVQLDTQPFNTPTPIQHSKEPGKRTDSLEHKPNSSMSKAQNTDSTGGSKKGSLHALDITEKNPASVSPWPSTTYTQRKNSVRFEYDTDLPSSDSSEYGRWHVKKTESPNNDGANKPSLYSLPLKLSDDMQTPGTVKNISPSKIIEEEDFNHEQDSQELGKLVEPSQNATSTPEKGLKKIPYDNEPGLQESLSSWLKPAAVILEERNKRMENANRQIRKAFVDRPIIGIVAAHWSQHEDSHAPPKWWDGNGIPNSTNKYKEDQKVSWHATPFEERLEKALSEETVISQRKDICVKPIAFDENEESDTALSQLQSSTNPQSVMSF